MPKPYTKEQMREYDAARNGTQIRKEYKRATGKRWYKEVGLPFRRAHYLSGVRLPNGEAKREYQGICELCGENVEDGKKKAYHH